MWFSIGELYDHYYTEMIWVFILHNKPFSMAILMIPTEFFAPSLLMMFMLSQR